MTSDSDSLLQNLLQRWSELEPCRCTHQSRSYWVAVGDSHGYAVSHEPTLIDLSLLMRGITTAIVTHNLRAKIENASDGWYATLTIASDSLIDCLTPHHDKECSIALLKAYVAWLESRAP